MNMGNREKIATIKIRVVRIYALQIALFLLVGLSFGSLEFRHFDIDSLLEGGVRRGSIAKQEQNLRPNMANGKQMKKDSTALKGRNSDVNA